MTGATKTPAERVPMTPDEIAGLNRNMQWGRAITFIVALSIGLVAVPLPDVARAQNVDGAGLAPKGPEATAPYEDIPVWEQRPPAPTPRRARSGSGNFFKKDNPLDRLNNRMNQGAPGGYDDRNRDGALGSKTRSGYQRGDGTHEPPGGPNYRAEPNAKKAAGDGANLQGTGPYGQANGGAPNIQGGGAYGQIGGGRN